MVKFQLLNWSQRFLELPSIDLNSWCLSHVWANNPIQPARYLKSHIFLVCGWRWHSLCAQICINRYLFLEEYCSVFCGSVCLWGSWYPIAQVVTQTRSVRAWRGILQHRLPVFLNAMFVRLMQFARQMSWSLSGSLRPWGNLPEMIGSFAD